MISGIRQAGRKSEPDAQAIASSQRKRYWNAIKSNAEDDIACRRQPPIYCIDDSFYLYKLPSEKVRLDGDNVTASLLESRPHILRQLDGMTDREYEAGVCVAMRLIGAKDVHLTPAGNEGGVDFYALLEGETHSHLFGKGFHCFRIVGQAKQYSDRESITRFNSFITVLHNIRHLDDSVTKHMPDWFRRGKGPIIGLYIAHSGFQAGASSTAAKHGILLADSVDIGEMCALSNLLNPTGDPAGRSRHFYDMVRGELA